MHPDDGKATAEPHPETAVLRADQESIGGGRRDRVALVAAFGGLGGTTAVIPAVIPRTAALNHELVSSYLAAVPATFLGLFVGVTLSIVVAGRVPARRVLMAGAVLQAAAVLVLCTSPSAPAFVATAAAAGVAFGMAEVTGITVARQTAGARTAQLLTVLTATSAAGAASCPLILILIPDQPPTPLGGLIAALHLTAAVLLIAAPHTYSSPQQHQVAATPSSPASQQTRRHQPAHAKLLTRTGLALACYVGVEAVLAGWSAVTLADLPQLSATDPAVGTAAFWGLMAFGRLLAATTLRNWLNPAACLKVAAGGATVCLVLAAAIARAAPTAGLAVVAAAIVFLSPYYSLILGLVLAEVKTAATDKTTGLLIATGALGGFVVPAAVLTTDRNVFEPTTLVTIAGLLLITDALSLNSMNHKHARADLT